jgi:hypothetical protein
MKRVHSKSGKLQLAKETLRSLTSSELGQVAGATAVACAVFEGTDAANTCNVGSSVHQSLASYPADRCLPNPVLTGGSWTVAAGGVFNP